MNIKLLSFALAILTLSLIINYHNSRKRIDAVKRVNVRKQYMKEATPEQRKYINRATQEILARLKQGDSQCIIDLIASDLTPWQIESLKEKLDSRHGETFKVKRVLSNKLPQPNLWEAECLSEQGASLYFQYSLCPPRGIRLCNVF